MESLTGLVLPNPCNPSSNFVEQYYHILHQTPELVYRFYHDSSVLSRLEPDGVMISVTTKKSINEKICSLDYKNYKAEIKTTDAQDSFKDGVIVLVTGCLTGKDNLRRKFTQSFSLAPQDNGYFVFNDVFRYVEKENEPIDTNTVIIEVINDTQSVSLTPDPEPSRVLDPPVQEHAKSHVEELQNGEGKTNDPINNESQLANEKAAVDPEPQPNENHNLEPASSYAQEDAPKKSYASIVISQTKKGNSGDFKVYVPTNNSRVAPTQIEKHSVRLVSQNPAPAAFAPTAPESSNAQYEGDGHSIYIKNLPLNVTVTRLKAEFKNFGPIKKGGVQVRSNKGFCFGFVEFKDLNSMHNAIQILEFRSKPVDRSGVCLY